MEKSEFEDFQYRLCILTEILKKSNRVQSPETFDYKSDAMTNVKGWLEWKIQENHPWHTAMKWANRYYRGSNDIRTQSKIISGHQK